MILRLTIIGLLAMATNLVKAESLTEKLQTCSGISDEAARLACYDQLVLAKSHSTKKATATQDVAQETTSTQYFGQEHKLRSTTPDKINVSVSQVKKSLRGKLQIILKNGQEWHQTDSTSFKINKEKKTYIKKGALSSFVLGQEGRNTTIRVKRIK